VNDLFDGVLPRPPSRGSTQEIPIFTTTRLRQVVIAFLAQVRSGVITLDDAQARIGAAFDNLETRQVAMAEARAAEVASNGEGRVMADPRATSARAARLVAPRTGSQRAQLLEFIVTAPGGATDFEAARDLRMLPNSVRPRRGELLEGGFIADSGQTRQHRGSQWTVWTATQAGHDWYFRSQQGAA
jgi:hypothetical protein